GRRRQPHEHDSILVIERRMREARTLRREFLVHVQRHTRIALLPVPVAPVALHLAERGWNLIRGGLDFLEAEDGRTFALDEFLELRLPRANAVDVPRRDFHG